MPLPGQALFEHQLTRLFRLYDTAQPPAGHISQVWHAGAPRHPLRLAVRGRLLSPPRCRAAQADSDRLAHNLAVSLGEQPPDPRDGHEHHTVGLHEFVAGQVMESSPHLITITPSPRLASPRLTSPRLTSPHLASPHLASPRLASIQQELIREKIGGRLEGGPAGLRRAFKIFDRDGSGSVSPEEFTEVSSLTPTHFS
jgi:hypothetical protein